MTTKLGQNFLHNKNIAIKIINEFLPQPGPVLEIGAGPGILSELLLEKIPADRLTMVEIDPFLVQNLRQRFGSQMQILEKNILEINLAELYQQEQLKLSDSAGGGSNLSVPCGQVAIIGNLPYLISKDLIDWLITQRFKISSAVLMLQKDFVDKLLAAAGGLVPARGKKYNAQSVVFQLLFQARRCFNVSPGSFTPRPQIMSTVLAIRPVEFPLAAETEKFYDFVKLCFVERRKTLWNNLATHIEKDLLSSMFGACNLEQHIRAEQLPASVFLELFKSVKSIAANFK